jgi:hypothetical protein
VEARRAVLAMIARQCLDVNELSVRGAVGSADPWDVIEILSNLIATRVKQETDDVEGWLQFTFLELASGEDE